MKNAKPKDSVEIKDLKVATHLNGARGHLVKYVKKEKRWAVQCHAGVVKVKPENLTLLNSATMNVVPDHPTVAEVLDNTHILSSIFEFLNWKGILRARVCLKWREAARLTHVPESETDDGWHTPELYVQNREVAEALGWIADALPGISSVNFLFSLRKTEEFNIADGEDPAPSLVFGLGNRPDPAPVDITPIANFRHLRNLTIDGASLNGSYPYLFDFPNLRSLELTDVGRLKWDLGMLRGLPKLQKLRCIRNNNLTGSLSSIRVLRESLVEICLSMCFEIEGSLMDLADFTVLKDLSLNQCNRVVGDIRDIGPSDFQSIESMTDLPDSVYGGGDLPSIVETPDIMYVWYILKKRNPKLLSGRRLSLSLESPDRYNNNIHHSRDMPSCVEFVEAGPRLGWRWTNAVSGGSCETNWLDPEPNPSDEDYDVYLKELKEIQRDVEFYKGLFRPPTQEEHLQRNSEIPLDPILQMYSNRSSFW